jgi:hypothetical protein
MRHMACAKAVDSRHTYTMMFSAKEYESMRWKEKHWGGHDTACILKSHCYKLLSVGNSWAMAAMGSLVLGWYCSFIAKNAGFILAHDSAIHHISCSHVVT